MQYYKLYESKYINRFLNNLTPKILKYNDYTKSQIIKFIENTIFNIHKHILIDILSLNNDDIITIIITYEKNIYNNVYNNDTYDDSIMTNIINKTYNNRAINKLLNKLIGDVYQHVYINYKNNLENIKIKYNLYESFVYYLISNFESLILITLIDIYNKYTYHLKYNINKI